MSGSELKQRCEHVFGFAAKQLRQLITSHPDQFPEFTVDGKWSMNTNPWTSWCEGFLGGQLWLLFEHTGDPWWREKAEHYSRLIEYRKTDPDIHDLGFLFWSTYKRWFDITDDPEKEAVVIEAGRTMADRFQEKGKYLCSFVGKESIFIDIMMNVGILFYAARRTGSEDLMRIARQHCHTTRRVLVRGDGSTAHEGVFDPSTGEFLRQTTHQGWRGDSSWARGLAWGLYGFGTAYSFSGDARFLQTARQLADFYIERTLPHGVPPNDWEEPDPQYAYESSAAAAAASGMLQLAGLVHEPAAAFAYRQYAETILGTLTSSQFLADNDPGYEGILKHGIYHLNRGMGIDESVMWGDYFLLEACSRVLAHE